MQNNKKDIDIINISRSISVAFIILWLIIAGIMQKQYHNISVYVIIISLIILFFATSIEYILRKYLRDNNSDKELERIYARKMLNKQAEIDALQSQINPHFLYNTLDSIRGKALMQDSEEIAEMTEALSTFFRYSISNRNNTVTLEEELENIQNYLKIQMFRFDNRFRLNIIDIDQKVLEKCKLPKLTLQPIIENTILHGIERKLGSSTITISATKTEKRFILTISDNGCGMSEETLLSLQAKMRGEDNSSLEYSSKRTGIALPNVNRRIKLLFGEEYGLKVLSTLGLGTDVEIILPIGGEEL